MDHICNPCRNFGTIVRTAAQENADEDGGWVTFVAVLFLGSWQKQQYEVTARESTANCRQAAPILPLDGGIHTTAGRTGNFPVWESGSGFRISRACIPSRSLTRFRNRVWKAKIGTHDTTV